MVAAATVGAMLFENKYGRERCRSHATISLRAETKPPLAPPSALPRVLVKMSMRPDDAAVFVRAAAAGADEAGCMRIIDHDQRTVALGQVANLIETRDRSVHGKHAVGCDQTHPRSPASP